MTIQLIEWPKPGPRASLWVVSTTVYGHYPLECIGPQKIHTETRAAWRKRGEDALVRWRREARRSAP